MEAGCEIPNWIKLTETLLEMGRDEVGVCTSRYFATAHEILFVVLNMVMSSHFFLHSSSSSAHIGVSVRNDGSWMPGGASYGKDILLKGPFLSCAGTPLNKPQVQRILRSKRLHLYKG